jgi:hypothetical protein
MKASHPLRRRAQAYAADCIDLAPVAPDATPRPDPDRLRSLARLLLAHVAAEQRQQPASEGGRP